MLCLDWGRERESRVKYSKFNTKLAYFYPTLLYSPPLPLLPPPSKQVISSIGTLWMSNIRTLLSLDIHRPMDVNMATITLDNLYLGSEPTVGSLWYGAKRYVYMKGVEINCIEAWNLSRLDHFPHPKLWSSFEGAFVRGKNFKPIIKCHIKI